MKFTDIFISRPVLAVVINVLILLVGARALSVLSVGQFPEVSNAIVNIRTAYPGADAELVKGFVTTPMEQAVSQAEGIDYINSNSLRGASLVAAYLRTDYDVNDALSQITTKISEVRNDLPPAAEIPTITIEIGAAASPFYASYASDTLDRNQVTDWVLRVAKPRFSTIPGVQTANILGPRIYAMRVWMDPARMAALKVTAGDIREALEKNNYLAAAGSSRGRSESFSVSTNTSLESVEEFRSLVVREQGFTQVTLGDVADVELGAEAYAVDVRVDGKPTVFVAIDIAPGANLLTTLREVREAFDELEPNVPVGIDATINRDASEYINESIRQVITTLLEALVIVVVVIFLFLGSLRATLVPAVAVPVSLVGVGAIMLLLGFNINLLTLLAMVLAIGLVVDDAIIVVENIHRHLEEGMPPMDAARLGARELAGPVIAMTITLLSVYAPIGFVGGLTGTLFSEFAFTLAGSVLISGVVALTLSPVMCALLLKPMEEEGRFARWLDSQFLKLRESYMRLLHRMLNFRPLVVAVGALLLASCYFLYRMIPAELAPLEDDAIFVYQAATPPNTSLDQAARYNDRLIAAMKSFPEVETSFHFNGGGGSPSIGFGGVGLLPSDQREQTAAQLLPQLQQAANTVPGVQVGIFPLPPLPSAGGGLPIQMVLTSTRNPEEILPLAEDLVNAGWGSGLFAFIDTDLKFDNAQTKLVVDREKAIDLGLDMESIGQDIATYLGDGYVNRFSLDGRSYKVIPQVMRDARLTPQQMLSYPIRTDSGVMLPLSAIATLEQRVEPQQLLSFQQLNAATISGIPAPGVTLGEALGFLEQYAADNFPRGFGIDYAGETRLYKSEQGTLLLTFFFAIVIIYLVLAAQFESFRDPLIMLVTVPLSVSGALAFLALGFGTMNIYTQVGLVTLIGLISKHGILIVQFANQLRLERDIDRRQAVEEACAIRLRPILMTTAAIVVAVMPLVFASGAGAASRKAIGTVIATGMSVGTLFTLFVVPAVYTYVAHRRPKQIANQEALAGSG